jgi:hypothetical protein
MTTGSTGTKRRTFFQRGLALLAGGAALGGARWAGAASPPAAAAAGNTLTLYARVRPAAGHQHNSDGRVLASGDLLDALDGEAIGTFYSNCFCVPTPFGVQQVSAPSTLEFHVLQLKDGTLFGMGSGRGPSGEQRVAIIGGTDRFSGRSGAYVQHPVAAGSRDVRELTITFAG